MRMDISFNILQESLRLRRKLLCNIFIEFGVSMELVRLIKMCLNELYSKICIGKCLSENYPI
jgi:hypothetical protein